MCIYVGVSAGRVQETWKHLIILPQSRVGRVKQYMCFVSGKKIIYMGEYKWEWGKINGKRGGFGLIKAGSMKMPLGNLICYQL